jgi:phage baseplate assembly protein W
MSKLQDLSEVSRKEREFYSDFFSDFSRNTVTGQLNKKTNEEAVKQSVKNLLLTNKYERLFHPEIGSNLTNMLFENNTTQTQVMLETYIEDVFENWEPRAELLSTYLDIKPDQNAMDVTIRFRLLNSTEPVSLTVVLERKR